MKETSRDYHKLFATIGQKSQELQELDEKAMVAITECYDIEAITHETMKKILEERYDAEFYSLRAAPIIVKNLTPEINPEEFQQKLQEIKAAKLESRKRREEVKEQIARKKEDIAKLEESFQKRLEICAAVNQLFNNQRQK